MHSWADKEMQTLELGDVRRSRRVAQMLDTLASKPGMSVPQACADKAEMNATYYAWNSPHVTPQAILGAHGNATVERIRQLPLVLVPNDTTNLALSSHEGVEDLGYLDRKGVGLLAHSAIAVSPEGVMLGVLHQELWSRDPAERGKKPDRALRGIADKESQKWLTALDAVQASVPETTIAVVIGDRESDLYPLFAHPREAHVELLVRSGQKRRVAEKGLLSDAVSAVLPCGTLTVEVPRADKRPARLAKLTLRYTTVHILAPKNQLNAKGLKPIEVNVVLAEEEAPASGVDPIRWQLLTTLPVASAREAAQCVTFYSRRWVIERFHFTLKSACRIEKLQLGTRDAFETAFATYSVVAWRLLFLTHQARVTPDLPCDVVFEQAEWEALCVRVSKKPQPPKKPPTLREAVRMIAKLGGFLGRKSDGEPGVKTLWQGLVALHECVEMYTAMRGIRPPQDHLRTFQER